MLGPDCWLTGAEGGYAAYPMWHGVETTDNTTHGRPVGPDAAHGNPHGTWFKVWESDCSNYNGCHPWFYGGDSPQSLPLMMDHWESVYGRGHNYILNLPPSKSGIIEPNMAAAAAAFGAERHRRYGAGFSDPDTPSACELARTSGRLAEWSPTGTATELLLHFPERTAFDRVFLAEDVIHDGQLVAQYSVDICSDMAGCTGSGDWRTVVDAKISSNGGQTIGTHHIDIVAANATAVRLRLLDVLRSPVLPLIAFRVLHVGSSETEAAPF